jgi:hypothetical protein
LLTGRPLPYLQIPRTAPTNISDRTLRIYAGLIPELRNDKLSKTTKLKNTSTSQTNLSMPISSSSSMLTPGYWMAIPSMYLVTTIEFSLEAQSQGAIRNKSFPSDLASLFRQIPIMAIEDRADTQVRK